MKQVIVNADDFGINEVVTSEIEQMIVEGRVSSTTIMANGKCLEEVKRFAIEHPNISYGIHLCLSEFDSLTKSFELHKAGLTDNQGRFVPNAIFTLKNLAKPEVKQAICNELNTQLDVIKELGIPLSHADSHHHVHSICALADVFIEVLTKHGIKKIRRAPDFHTFRAKMHLLQYARLNQLNKTYSSYFRTTDDFYSYGMFIRKGQPFVQGGVVELMCHPGHPGAIYCQEMDLLKRNSLLKSTDVKLVSYNEVV